MSKTRTAPWDYENYRPRNRSKWMTSACPNCGSWAVLDKCDHCGYKGTLVLVQWSDLKAIQGLIQDAQAESKIVGKGNRSAGA